MAQYEIAACLIEPVITVNAIVGILDKIRRLKIKKMERYVDRFFAVNPDLIKFLPDGSEFFALQLRTRNRISQA